MPNVLDFEGFLERKNRERAFFICLLDNGEKSYLESDTHWIHHSPFKNYLVRLNEDQFNMHSIGIHPNVLLYDNGR